MLSSKLCRNINYGNYISQSKGFRLLKTQTSSQFSNESLLANKNNEDKQPLANRLLYNSIIFGKEKLGYFQTLKFRKKQMQFRDRTQPLPLSLKFFYEDIQEKKTEVTNSESPVNIQFPYKNSTDVKEISPNKEDTEVCQEISESINKEVRYRNEELRKWMNAYDNFEHDIESDENAGINYGTPDPKSQFSTVPCGGCGAFLHCKDTALPGYIPSEIFNNSEKHGGVSLEAIICQRCFFLKEHDIALQVRVNATDYPKVLMSLRNKKALVVLMVDLTDFPCSIWPGIADILGPKIPIFVVGNKIDLIPKDSKEFIQHIKEKLSDHLKICGFRSSNILQTAIISAKTGYGVEDLITSLQSLWKIRGDVYLVGCTNVGKSSLFNALLGSDFCKVQASDLIQRATTSQWPGTTLNLLKFPILRPSAHRVYLRSVRLSKMTKAMIDEEEKRREELRRNNVAANATLIGRIERSVPHDDDGIQRLDEFSMRTSTNSLGGTRSRLNENDPNVSLGRWCYDTPGVIHPDQILDLLTLDELIFTLPKELIRPQTFCIKPGTSLFIAGLARLDYVNGPNSIILTVFRSNELPLTVCNLELADEIYDECVSADLFKVPINQEERLKKWPGLKKSKPFMITGIYRGLSTADIVLSNAGWISITCSPNEKYAFQAWTPEKRGINLRDSILPRAVTLRGKRIRDTVVYQQNSFI